MNEPSTGENDGPGERAAVQPKPSGATAARARRLRNTLFGVIGALVILAVLTVGGFALFSQFDPRDPDPKARDFEPGRASSGGAYYRVRIDYLPRKRNADGGSRLHDFGASLFDEGLTTTVVVEMTRGQGPVKRLAEWSGARPADIKGRFTAFRKQDGATVAVTVTRAAAPRLRWGFGLPQWATDSLGALVSRAGADQPPLIRIAPPAAGVQPAVTTIVVRDYKGLAIGDVYVTSEWRPSALFEAALIRIGPTPNPAIASFVSSNADAAARRAVVLRMIRSAAAEFTQIEAMKPWIVQRFSAMLDNRAHYADKAGFVPKDLADRFSDSCAETFDAATGRFGLVAADAALLTYFLHRDEPSFTGAASLTAICGRQPLGAALIAIGAPMAVEQAPPPKTKPVARSNPGLRPVEILRRLAREWKAGLARNGRAESMRFLRTDATLVKPNRFNLFRVTPFADRAAILADHAANHVRHFACFTKLAENSVAAIVERRQGSAAATSVFRYRFFFDRGNKIYRITRRKALQADINEVKFTLRGTDCTDGFLRVEDARIRQVIDSGRLAEPAPAGGASRNAAPLTVIESTLSWQSPAPGGRARNRVTVDLNVLKSIRKNTLPRGGG